MSMRKKVLLMGRSGAGKTSMRSIIFANFLARETEKLNPTLDVEHSSVRFMGDLTLNLWDCGGQEAFYESYFESERDSIFQDVEVLIYVIDIKSVESDLDLKNYGRCIDAIAVHSSTAKVFCLIHKMDTVPIASRTHVFRRKESEIISRSRALDARCYATSIWDETLYKAWSSIVHALIPNISNLERSLNEFADACGADEVVLFERATFLVVTHCTRKHHADPHRFEKVSNIVKQFKLACINSSSQLDGLRVANSHFAAVVHPLTSTMFAMVVVPRPGPATNVVLSNLAVVRSQFELLLAESTSETATSVAAASSSASSSAGAGPAVAAAASSTVEESKAGEAAMEIDASVDGTSDGHHHHHHSHGHHHQHHHHHHHSGHHHEDLSLPDGEEAYDGDDGALVGLLGSSTEVGSVIAGDEDYP